MNAAAPATRAIPAGPQFRVTAAQIGLAAAALLVIVGWLSPLGTYITPRAGLGYALGIIGGSLMLALLIYPARKRLPSRQS